MNVFVLSTGRCGSTTFIRACAHITNYTASHELKTGLLGDARFNFPEDHIAADTRLAWLLGRLEEAHGQKAFYVHLQRDAQAVARSYAHRWHMGITKAYREGIVEVTSEHVDPLEVTTDYVHTVNSNIALFLRDKPLQMTFHLEQAEAHFRIFWDRIGAEGDLDAAQAEFLVKHNAARRTSPGFLSRAWRKLGRLVAGVPRYLREA